MRRNLETVGKTSLPDQQGRSGNRRRAALGRTSGAGMAPHPSSTPADVAVKIKRGELSCWTTRTTPRGRWLSRSYFDVPDEAYAAGYATGARLARDLIQLVRMTPPERLQDLKWSVQATFREAAAVPSRSGRSGASVGFLNTMAGVLLGGIMFTDADSYAEAMINDADGARAWCVEQEARNRAAFVQRMRSARAAKRQQGHVDESGRRLETDSGRPS